MNLANMIDHTILKPDCRVEEIRKLCEEAIALEFAAVCVPPYFVKEAAHCLKNAKVKVATVIGFPYGYSATPAKVEEIKRAIDDGIDEVDVVVNICAIKQGNWHYAKNDIESMTLAAHLKGKGIKIIFETSMLTEEEILKLCAICNKLSVNFVKTSTGINGSGATNEMVSFLRKNLPDNIKIKASGGIRTIEQINALVEAGASRIGTSSGNSIFQKV